MWQSHAVLQNFVHCAVDRGATMWLLLIKLKEIINMKENTSCVQIAGHWVWVRCHLNAEGITYGKSSRLLVTEGGEVEFFILVRPAVLLQKALCARAWQSHINIWKADGGEWEGAAIKVCSSVLCSRAPLLGRWSHMGQGGAIWQLSARPDGSEGEWGTWEEIMVPEGAMNLFWTWHSCTHWRLGKITKHEMQILFPISSPQKPLSCESVGAGPRGRNLLHHKEPVEVVTQWC